MESSTPFNTSPGPTYRGFLTGRYGPVGGVTQVKAMGIKAGWHGRVRRREESSLLDEDKTSQPDTKDGGQLRMPAVRHSIRGQVHMQPQELLKHKNNESN